MLMEDPSAVSKVITRAILNVHANGNK